MIAAIARLSSATSPITFPLLVPLLPTRGVLLLLLLPKPASLFRVTVCLLLLLIALRTLLRLTYLLLALLLRALFALLGLADLLLALLCGTLCFLILALDIATLFLRLLFALSLLFPALLTLLAVWLLLLATMLGLLPTLLLLRRLFASAFGLLRWLRSLPFFTPAFAGAWPRSLFSLGLVLLALLLTSTTPPLSIGKVGGAQYRAEDRRRHCELF